LYQKEDGARNLADSKSPHCPLTDLDAAFGIEPLPKSNVILNAVKDLRLFFGPFNYP
jgi:hypothetical protein